LARAAADRVKRALEGASEFVKREEILLPDRQSAELAAAARRGNPAAVDAIPLEYVDDTLERDRVHRRGVPPSGRRRELGRLAVGQQDLLALHELRRALERALHAVRGRPRQ